MKHRPIGIGVQGFADALQKMSIPFEDEKAVDLDDVIAKIDEIQLEKNVAMCM